MVQIIRRKKAVASFDKAIADIKRKLENGIPLSLSEELIVDDQLDQDLYRILNDLNLDYKCTITTKLYEAINPTEYAKSKGQTLKKRCEAIIRQFERERKNTDALWFNFQVFFNIYGMRSIQPLRIRTKIDNLNREVRFELV